MSVPQAANDRWSPDFTSEAVTNGRRFRALAVVDDFTRDCLAQVANTSLSGARVLRQQDAVIARRGRPGTIVCDDGTGLILMAILTWCQRTDIAWHYITPGKPRNAVAGSLGPMAFPCSTSRASVAAFETSA